MVYLNLMIINQHHVWKKALFLIGLKSRSSIEVLCHSGQHHRIQDQISYLPVAASPATTRRRRRRRSSRASRAWRSASGPGTFPESPRSEGSAGSAGTGRSSGVRVPSQGGILAKPEITESKFYHNASVLIQRMSQNHAIMPVPINSIAKFYN